MPPDYCYLYKWAKTGPCVLASNGPQAIYFYKIDEDDFLNQGRDRIMRITHKFYWTTLTQGCMSEQVPPRKTPSIKVHRVTTQKGSRARGLCGEKGNQRWGLLVSASRWGVSGLDSSWRQQKFEVLKLQGLSYLWLLLIANARCPLQGLKSSSGLNG